ncbi:hypothetical protein V8F33_000585 [Rhypophila sp. PSN 637]
MLLSVVQVYAKMSQPTPPLDDDSLTSSDSGDEVVRGEGINDVASPQSGADGLVTPSDDSPQPSTMALPSARAYQREMLEESLKQNVIVAMDTGSGKTRVAVMRIIKELERSPKRVWFLAPTVDLANQQYEVLRAHIIHSKLICGADNVDAWSTQQVWDALLLNIRLVVSTFQILFDAVQHSFVRLDSLSLVVIDEAHNCVGANPVARLMKEFYAPAKRQNQIVPHILGLTASPLMRMNLKDIDVLENTLDAICKTPTKHREELMAQVNRPEIMTMPYAEPDAPERPFIPTRVMSSLRKAYLDLDIKKDPYILRLVSGRNTLRNKEELKRAVLQHDTYSQKQMRSFYARASEIWKQVGPWAADYYIYRVITEFTDSLATTSELLEGWSEQERVYLGEAFRKVNIPSTLGEPNHLAPKMEVLLSILQQDREDPMGIVFVKERATVAVVAHILSIHPLIRGRYRVGSVVGSSTMPGKRRDFLDLSRKEDLLSLERFRLRKFNLLVATSVLEEGIDVPECNLVICFDEITSPKAFIQRRGRARMAKSQLYLIVENLETKAATTWLDFERKMKARYEDEKRERVVMEEIEESDIGLAEYEVLSVESTGARLTIRDAKGHLQHFCASLASRKFTDWSPYYVFHDTNGKPVVDVTQSIPMRATVHLPASLDPSLRKFESLNVWTSERNAAMDAAFQAYKALYNAGLISQNLLPLSEKDIFGEIDHRTGFSKVGEQFDPWYLVAQAWRHDGALRKLFKRRLTISNHDQSMHAEFDLVLPVPIPYMEQLTLWWDGNSAWTIGMGEDTDELSRANSRAVYFSPAPDHTSALLAYSFGYRFKSKQIEHDKQYPFRLVSLDQNLAISDMGAIDFDSDSAAKLLPKNLIRDLSNDYHPYRYLQTIPTKPAIELVGRPYRGFDQAPDDIPYVSLAKWPRKAGYFHNPSTNNNTQQVSLENSKPYPRVLPISQVKIDNCPPVFTHIGMLIPALTKALEIHLVASDLLQSRLSDLSLPADSLSQIVTAICSTSARTPANYERIEFLGDSILKFCATVYASSKNLLWPEGYLSLFKDNIVSNSRLAKAAVEFGLDRYIIYKPFSLQKWKPRYVEDLLATTPSGTANRTLPTKTLADVVESVIGVAFIQGGYPKSLECIRLFLPTEKWTSIEEGRSILYNNAQSGYGLPVTFQKLEGLVGYTFRKKSLLVEAMTHCSFNGSGGDSIPCLDRLEFLGDSILDFVVVRKLFGLSNSGEGETEKGLENHEMHLLRTSLVNGDILAFLVMEWGVEEVFFETVREGDNSNSGSGEEETPAETSERNTKRQKKEVKVSNRKVKIPLWSFMRHSSPDMGIIHTETAKRHAELRDQINEALFGEGEFYPWELLLRLGAQKFYSDLFESLLGAVWVDSGSIEACEEVVERIGILRLLRRLRRDKVHCLHPKEELGRLALSEKVEYVVVEGSGSTGGKQGEEKVGNGERRFQCWVRVGEREVAHVEGALTKEEARVRGAREACRVLKGGMEVN